jgi:hypothetical protein
VASKRGTTAARAKPSRPGHNADRQKNRVDPAKVDRARVLFEVEGMSVRGIAKTVGLAPATIDRYRLLDEREGNPWKKGAGRARIQQAAMASVQDREAERIASMAQVYGNAWRGIATLAGRELKRLHDQQERTGQLDAATLKHLTTALARAQMGERLAHGFGPLPMGAAPRTGRDGPLTLGLRLIDSVADELAREDEEHGE